MGRSRSRSGQRGVRSNRGSGGLGFHRQAGLVNSFTAGGCSNGKGYAVIAGAAWFGCGCRLPKPGQTARHDRRRATRGVRTPRRPVGRTKVRWFAGRNRSDVRLRKLRTELVGRLRALLSIAFINRGKGRRQTPGYRQSPTGSCSRTNSRRRSATTPLTNSLGRPVCRGPSLVQRLAAAIPETVNRLTPDGRLPSETEAQRLI